MEKLILGRFIFSLFAIPALFLALGCSDKNSELLTPPSESVTEQEGTLRINVGEAMSNQAQDLFRPGVVAYGLLLADKYKNYYGLKQFSSATQSRGGYVKIEEISSLIREMSSAADLPAKLLEVDEAVSLAISGGSKVELIIACSLPNFLSKLEGYNHDVISGENIPNGQPMFSCAPLKNATLARNTWTSIMKEVAKFFSKYGDDVVFIIGNEPETYFAGNSAELFEIFEITAKGLRAGNGSVKIGGLSPSRYDLDNLGHTEPVYDSGADSFSFSKEVLGAPLLQLWLKDLNTKNLGIDIIQTKHFGANPAPASSGFWVKEHLEIETWLQANPNSYNSNVELIYSDFPGWHTVCAEDQFGNWESVWDSEYFSSWYVSTYLSMKQYATERTGIINNVEPLLSFLIEFGSDAYFHTSCEPDESRPAGFRGAIGLITGKSKLPKPILHSLNLLTGLSGSIVKVKNDDTNIQAIAAYDKQNSQVSVLISHFVPSELSYNTAGWIGYDWGQLFNNHYGIDFDMKELKSMSPNSELQKYLDDPNFPKGFVHDLLAGPEVLDLNTLELPDNFVEFFNVTRAAGMKHRKIKEQYNKGLKKKIHLDFSGLLDGSYTLVHQVIDKDHGNAYTERESIQSELEAAHSQGGEVELKKKLEEVRVKYGIDSTFLSEKSFSVKGATTVEVSLNPNSVHLLILKKNL
jgi:hypothetical protein